ncbi:MAG: type I-U CRISPR-associated protein Cas5/Cas6 [Alphaproteobacteria bacterium]|nr:type I-U CRISPR-associated protein Cas5/Cas6 [Alphaproteobacteria bacterium]
MSQRLVIEVHLAEARFHGRPEWPPSPARLFQALVAGLGPRSTEPRFDAALRWLERSAPPTIAAPHDTPGQAVTAYVPNNDLDAKGGDPAQVASLRTAKTIWPRHLSGTRLLYVWAEEPEDLGSMRDVVAGLYQLGRGVDMAWADVRTATEAGIEDELSSWAGRVHRPSPGGGAEGLLCPRPGTLDSLHARHAAAGQRFRTEGQGRTTTQVFRQPPKPLLRLVSYDASVRRLLLELRSAAEPGRFAPAPAPAAVGTVVGWRDAAVERLVGVGAERAVVESVLVGRRPGEPERLPSDLRVRIVPLPSIGHEHTDPAIRRLLVEVPEGGPIGFDDVRWAFSGLTREGAILVEAEDDAMLGHYLGPARHWSTVTPVALPVGRRRLEPSDPEHSKSAEEREAEEGAAVQAVLQALRHAGVRASPTRIEVRREPSGPGDRAEAYEAKPRFAKERLWHVDLHLREELTGPLVLGDGRWLGLGLFRPHRLARTATLRAWVVTSGLEGTLDPLGLASHLRRAVLCRAQESWGRRALPGFVTGHTRDGRPMEGHEHLHFLVDPARRRLLVWSPVGDPRLERALDGLDELRAGRMGVLSLRPVDVDDTDPLLRASTSWRTITPYRVNRHRRAGSAVDAIAQDVLSGWTGPRPTSVRVEGIGSRAGLEAARVEIHLDHAIRGPLVLGKTRHQGGGLFESTE